MTRPGTISTSYDGRLDARTLPVRVADDAAGRREDHAADDVLVGDGGVGGAVERLELEEAPDDRDEREKRCQRHPLVALAELARRPSAGRSRLLTASLRWPRPAVGLPVATCTAWAMRKTIGATAAVAIACGSVSG